MTTNHQGELDRLQALHAYQILDTLPEAAYDDLVKLAAQLCETPIAIINFIDEQRQWYKAVVGLPIHETARVDAFCEYAIQGKTPFIVPNTLQDERFAQHPFVTSEPHIRFYAGFPLVSPRGQAVGTLVVMDVKPQELTSLQINALKVLANQVVSHLELRLVVRQQAQSLHEQREAEEALRASEERFRRLFISAAAGISQCDLQGNFVQVNPAFCEIVGYSEEELLNLDFITLTHPDDRQSNLEMVHQLLAGEVDTFVLEKRYLKKGGDVVWARVSISCIYAEQNEPLYTIGVSEDISERIRAQTTVSSLEQRLAVTLENMTDAFCLLDKEWRITYLNKVAERLILHTSEQMINLSLWERFPPTSRSLLFTEFQRAIQEQQPVHFELFYPPLANWFEVHAYPTLEGMAVYFRVITERKQAIDELRASQERFEIVARATNDAIWDWDLTTNRVWWNEGFVKLFGYSRDDLEQSLHFWTNRIHPDDRDRVYASVATLINEGGENWTAEYRFIGKDGSVAHVLDRGFLIRNDEGKPLRMVGSMINVTERNKAEGALRESEERFRQMAETIDDAFWIWDAVTDTVAYANPRYESIFGHSRDELYRNSRSFKRDIHPDDLPRLIQELANNPFSFQLDFRILPPGDSLRWVGLRTFPVHDAEGKVVRAVGVARDITLLMQATEQLQASEQQYRLLFNNNPHPMWVYDAETLGFLAVNDAAIAYYGYSEEEFLAMTIRDIRPLEDMAALERNVAAWVPRKDSGAWRHRKKDGAVIDVEISSDAIQFDDRPARLVLANDVTARRRAEAQVHEQAALLDKAQDAILVRDLNHRITYWNRGAERLYGWRTDEVAGRRSRELLFKDLVAFDRAHQQLLIDGEWFGELQQSDRNGRDLLIEARWTLVRNEDGVPRSVLSINTDITERKKLEAQFLRSQRMESIGTLAGGIAHDLNNVLAPILLSLGMLKRQSRTPGELKLLNTLESSAQRGADLVRQVLTFARGVEGQRVVTDVGLVVKDLENLIRDTFDRNILVKVTCAENLWPIMGDPTQIHQLVLNLCVNARDAMSNGGGELEIKVELVLLDKPYGNIEMTGEPGRYVVLSVSDSGSGIPASIRDRIFDPFFTTKEVGKGTGLGLSTVQAVVKSHGGFLNVNSEEGQGTEFKVYLPALDGELGNELHTQTPQLRRSDGALVLVVDDEAAIRLTAQQTLEAFGYRVLIAHNGAEALEIYKAHKQEIAVVLTDMMMPGMDGPAVIEALLAINPLVRIVAASGLAAQDTIAKATSAGVRHFLPKPYTAEALLKSLGEALDGENNSTGEAANAHEF